MEGKATPIEKPAIAVKAERRLRDMMIPQAEWDGLSEGAANSDGRVKLLRHAVVRWKRRGQPASAIFKSRKIPPCPSGSLGRPRFFGSVAIIPARSTLEWPVLRISEMVFEAETCPSISMARNCGRTRDRTVDLSRMNHNP
jgi:hypothetical protein